MPVITVAAAVAVAVVVVVVAVVFVVDVAFVFATGVCRDNTPFLFATVNGMNSFYDCSLL